MSALLLPLLANLSDFRHSNGNFDLVRGSTTVCYALPGRVSHIAFGFSGAKTGSYPLVREPAVTIHANRARVRRNRRHPRHRHRARPFVELEGRGRTRKNGRRSALHFESG